MIITGVERVFTYGGLFVKYSDSYDITAVDTRDILVGGFEGRLENCAYVGVASPTSRTNIPDYKQLPEILAVVREMVEDVCKEHNHPVPAFDGVSDERLTYYLMADNCDIYEVTATPLDDLTYSLSIPDYEEVISLAYDDYRGLEDLVRNFMERQVA